MDKSIAQKKNPTKLVPPVDHHFLKISLEKKREIQEKQMKKLRANPVAINEATILADDHSLPPQSFTMKHFLQNGNNH